MAEFPTTDNIIDVDLRVTAKKKFRFDGDNSRIVAIDVSDTNIMKRVTIAYPILNDLQAKAAHLGDNKDDSAKTLEEQLAYVSSYMDGLIEVDTEMRKQIDFIFNAPVSAAAAPEGNMYDVFDGNFRFEYVISTVLSLISDNLSEEYSKLEKRVKSHTAKYTGA